MNKVKAVFVSHEHSDHIRGIQVIAKKYQVPVYITSPTLMNGRLEIEPAQVRPFGAYEPVVVGGLTITAFPKFHDACDPYSFVIRSASTTIGVFTDIGEACEHVTRHFKECHAAFLEANYDEDMLEKGSYPYHLKKRIRGGRGHLSNRQALELFVKHKPAFMSHLFLSHLSQDNNCPDLVQNLFSSHAGGTNVVVASRYRETALYEIDGRGSEGMIRAPRGISITQLRLEFN